MPPPDHEMELPDFSGDDPLEKIMKMLPTIFGNLNKRPAQTLVQLTLVGRRSRYLVPPLALDSMRPRQSAFSTAEINANEDGFTTFPGRAVIVPADEVQVMEQSAMGTIIVFRGESLLVSESMSTIIRKAGLEVR